MDLLAESPILRKGLVNFPGITLSSKKKTSELLAKDVMQYHCFFVPDGRHNHLSHHVLAAYDLGAPPNLLQRIFEEEAKIQRPLKLEASDEHITITDENWLQYIENQHAYHGFIIFFSNKLRTIGFHALLNKYLFSDQANKNGANMLIRLVSNGVHAFIHMGYGVEFGNDAMVVTGLAQCAVQASGPEDAFRLLDTTPNLTNGFKSSEKDHERQPTRGLSLLEILQQIYDSETLDPPPFDAEASFLRRGLDAVSGERSLEIKRICAQYHTSDLSETEINEKSEEFIWVSTLLLFVTGREGKEPRLDFCLMHMVTSSLLLISLLRKLQDSTHRELLLRTYLGQLVYYMLMAGRPKIQPNLLMSYIDKPRPPLSSLFYKPDKSAIGTPTDDEDYSPWPIMIDAVLYAPDAHTVKILRTLIYAAQHFGDTPQGGAIGAWNMRDSKEETIPGTSKMDGSIFVRAAGVLMDYMGWVTYGQAARDDWDRSGLGWDAAWEHEV